MATTEHLWLIRPKPEPLEALSSWLVRVANACGQRLHSFSTDHWPDLELWTRDVDHLAPPVVLETLVLRTATTARAVRATTFASYSGVLFDGDDPITGLGYIRPIGVYHRLRRAFGLQYCPSCLREDKSPYYRLSWRLSLFPVCTRHGKILLDRCGQCDSPVIPHRGGMICCHKCESSLATMPQRHADTNAVQFQLYNEAVLAGHRIVKPMSLLGLHPLMYFRLIRCLASNLLHGARRNAFRAQVSTFLHEPLPRLPDREKVELRFLEPEAAHDVLRAISALLVGWPARFVGAAQESGLWHSWAKKDIDPTIMPFAFMNVVETYLRVDPNTAKRNYHYNAMRELSAPK